jgi:hypothetical protein
MATSVVLPLESQVKWHDTEHKYCFCPILNGASRLLPGPMARPPPAAEPGENTFSQKPILPPFSKFLSDAGQPDLFTPSRTQQIREEPTLSASTSLNNHLVQPNPFRPSEAHPATPIDPPPQPRNGHHEMHNGHMWSYQNTSPLAARVAVPGTVSTNRDRSIGPAILREEVIPGRGPCYVYQDGSVLQKIINGDTVNPKWGTTKAGKPRKRRGQACNTCREKKIKCDPSVPKCAQCQKFGRECRFDSTYEILRVPLVAYANRLVVPDLDNQAQQRRCPWPRPRSPPDRSCRSTILEEGQLHPQTQCLKSISSLEPREGLQCP